jgi:putative transposase
MQYKPQIHDRKSIRLNGYDYAQTGFYFITLCTHNRDMVFGNIKNCEMVLNDYGNIVMEQALQYGDEIWMV